MQTTSHHNPLQSKPSRASADIQKALTEFGSIGKGNVLLPSEAITAGIAIGNGFIQCIKVVLIYLSRAVIIPFELLLRSGFGERYFNPIHGILFVASIFAANTFRIIGKPAAITILVTGVLLLGFSSLKCFIRDRRGEYWHSYFEGESRFRLPPIDRFLHQWFFTFDFSKLVLEPLLVLGLGAALEFLVRQEPYSAVAYNVGRYPLAYFGSVAAAMFGHQYYCYRQRREATLNEKDAIIISQAKTASLQPSDDPKMKFHRGVAYLPPVKPNAWQRSVTSGP